MPNIVRENLLRLYGVEINKSEDDSEIEKGGEGSRGGKIIGHTKSGKPIYDSANHESHKNFTKEDHNDAADLHSKLYEESHESFMKFKESENEDDNEAGYNAFLERNKHAKEYNRHTKLKREFGKEKKKTVKRTSSSVPMYSSVNSQR